MRHDVLVTDFAAVPAALSPVASAAAHRGLSVASIAASAGFDLAEALVIRHAFVTRHDDTGENGVHADSTPEEILYYTARQEIDPRRFPQHPPRLWLVFMKEGGDRARFWSLVENRGELSRTERLRHFDLVVRDDLADLANRLVVGWPAPRNWWVHGRTAAPYPVLEIADARPVPFPGFDALVLDYLQLQAVMREHRYAAWRTALTSVMGIYLITDTRDGRAYVGKADGAENISQRWGAYARDGHGGNVELRGLDPSTFRYSLLRVFDPSTPRRDIDAAESHFKLALDSRRHGLNRN